MRHGNLRDGGRLAQGYSVGSPHVLSWLAEGGHVLFTFSFRPPFLDKTSDNPKRLASEVNEDGSEHSIFKVVITKASERKSAGLKRFYFIFILSFLFFYGTQFSSTCTYCLSNRRANKQDKHHKQTMYTNQNPAVIP